jgi:hypothetical protein
MFIHRDQKLLGPQMKSIIGGQAIILASWQPVNFYLLNVARPGFKWLYRKLTAAPTLFPILVPTQVATSAQPQTMHWPALMGRTAGMPHFLSMATPIVLLMCLLAVSYA